MAEGHTNKRRTLSSVHVKSYDELVIANESLNQVNRDLIETVDRLTSKATADEKRIWLKSGTIANLNTRLRDLRKAKASVELDEHTQTLQEKNGQLEQELSDLRKQMRRARRNSDIRKVRLAKVEAELIAFQDIEPGTTAAEFKKSLRKCRDKAAQAGNEKTELLKRLAVLENASLDSEIDAQKRLKALKEEHAKLMKYCNDLKKNEDQQHSNETSSKKALGETYNLIIVLEALLEQVPSLMATRPMVLVDGLKEMKDQRLKDIINGINNVKRDEARYRLLLQKVRAATGRI